MRPPEIEYWTLQIVDRVLLGQPVEDARVELKADWLPADKAARRLAGHANAARGQPILWIIGVDEKKRSLVDLDRTELAGWWARVAAQFDDVSPALTDLVVRVQGSSVVALYFETMRAPYVVRNAAYGTPTGGSVELEVPWREATAVRSARREELLRILVPITLEPRIELLDATVSVNPQKSTRAADGFVTAWTIDMRVYIEPMGDDRVVFPMHRASLSLRLPATRTTLRPPKLGYRPTGSPNAPQSATVFITQSEVVDDGPGLLTLACYFTTAVAPSRDDDPLELELSLRQSASESAIVSMARPRLLGEFGDRRGRWTTKESTKVDVIEDGWAVEPEID